MSSHVQEVLKRFDTEMTREEMCKLIVSIEHASAEDERQTNLRIHEREQSLLSDITERDQRDARLQHYMSTHNVPLDEHMNAYRRNVDNLNSLYQETFGFPRMYERERKNVEQMTLFQRMNK